MGFYRLLVSFKEIRWRWWWRWAIQRPWIYRKKVWVSLRSNLDSSTRAIYRCTSCWIL